MSQNRLPAKTAIRVDALIESTLTTIQGASTDQNLAPLVHSAMASFVESLARTVLTPEQQQKVTSLLDIWKTYRPVT
jgi:hypothetical protein